MPSSMLSLVPLASREPEVEARQFDARLTNRDVEAIRLDVAARDLTMDGFDAEGPHAFLPSELFDVAFRGQNGWSVRLRVRVVDCQWFAVRGTAVSYLTRFQFVHAEAPSTRSVVDEILSYASLP